MSLPFYKLILTTEELHRLVSALDIAVKNTGLSNIDDFYLLYSKIRQTIATQQKELEVNKKEVDNATPSV